jgi:GMP reductase
MRIENDPKLDFDDVLIRPKRSVLGSRKAVDLVRQYHFKHSCNSFTGIPIIAANMSTIGTYAMAEELEKYALGTALHKHYTVQSLFKYFQSISHKQFVFYSMGILEQDLEKFNAVASEAIIDFLCVDVANGYSERFVDFLKELRDTNPAITIMAGNVVTGEMVEQLILNGVDIVKVGIGPGSVCTTRKMTGVGYPQLSAILECMDAAHGLGGLICADGGCRVPGDVAKAFGAGADFVMLGGMFAGHDECEGDLVREMIGMEDSGAPIFGPPTGMKFYGMSSSTAMEKYSGGVADYRASEGKEVIVPYRGPVKDTVQQILGGLRSACTYTGARTLKDLSKCTTFVRVNSGRQLNTVFGE